MREPWFCLGDAEYEDNDVAEDNDEGGREEDMEEADMEEEGREDDVEGKYELKPWRRRCMMVW